MFAHVNTVYLSLVFALCASRAIVSVQDDAPNCSSGSTNCCQSTTKPTDTIVTVLAVLLSIDLGSKN
ncbi:hypothetical protein H2248_002379 [Termitomyces sp. 'cryptogamus']|nr:hypothetical protein H2248_002379 [Termitomyces sp. 'cryptogamus']